MHPSDISYPFFLSSESDHRLKVGREGGVRGRAEEEPVSSSGFLCELCAREERRGCRLREGRNCEVRGWREECRLDAFL